jgi:hypothetical protein
MDEVLKVTSSISVDNTSIDLTFDLVSSKSILLWDPALELVPISVDYCQIVVAEPSPLLLDFAFQLLPVPFAIAIHHVPPWFAVSENNMSAKKSSEAFPQGLPEAKR